MCAYMFICIFELIGVLDVMFSGDQRELVGIIVDLANSHTDTPRSWPPDVNIKMLE